MYNASTNNYYIVSKYLINYDFDYISRRYNNTYNNNKSETRIH